MIELLSQAQTGVTMERLVAICGTPKAAYAKLKRLEDANLPVVRDKTGIKTRYRIDRKRLLVLLADEVPALEIYLALGRAHGLAESDAEAHCCVVSQVAS